MIATEYNKLEDKHKDWLHKNVMWGNFTDGKPRCFNNYELQTSFFSYIKDDFIIPGHNNNPILTSDEFCNKIATYKKIDIPFPEGSKFDIEQCREDENMAIHEALGGIKVLAFEPDVKNLVPCLVIESNEYWNLSLERMSNIPKKKNVTIYVYKNSHGAIFCSFMYPKFDNFTVIDTIEKEYDL